VPNEGREGSAERMWRERERERERERLWYLGVGRS